MIAYEDLHFPLPTERPYFISSFVQTIDGKIWVYNNGYWPLGSSNDLDTYTYLRAHADAIVDGFNTAKEFGLQTIERIHTPQFKQLRNELEKKRDIEYIVLTNKGKETVEELLVNKHNYVPKVIPGSLDNLIEYLNSNDYKLVLVDGGPHLVRSLLKQNLIDELFITIAPKIIGNEPEKTLTLAEGGLFEPDKLPEFTLFSLKRLGNEAFLRYKKR